MTADDQYRALLRDLLDGGMRVKTRNARVRRLLVRRADFTAAPLVGARKTAWKNALREMEWFLSGSDNINDLHPAVRPWWGPWADPSGRVRNNYSAQFRRFVGRGGVVDQVQAMLEGVRDHPFSRRNVLTTWNAADMLAPETPITNCHNTVTQAFVDAEDRLHLFTYQRSVDVVCGLPHNWIQEWALLLWLASHTGRGVGSLVWVGGDVHLYDEHGALAREVLAAAPAPTPGLLYAPSAADFKADDFTLDGPYTPATAGRAAMVV